MTTAAKTHTTTQSSEASSAEQGPIVVELGKASRKNVRKLRKGRPGKLLRRVEETIAHLRESGALAKDAEPLIIVVREKPRRRRAGRMLGL